MDGGRGRKGKGEVKGGRKKGRDSEGKRRRGITGGKKKKKRRKTWQKGREGME